MSTFRTGQNQANTRKLNNILSTIIFILILNVGIQIWLLYASLNNALDSNKEILIPSFFTIPNPVSNWIRMPIFSTDGKQKK